MSSPSAFSERDRDDLLEFYRIYDFSKLKDVDSIVAGCVSAGTTPPQLFEDLYRHHRVACLPDRSGAASRLRAAVPDATCADVESALRLAEMKGFSECDALRSLQPKFGERRVTSPVRKALREGGPSSELIDKKQLIASPTRAAIDEVMAEECREWVAKVVGDAHNHEVLSETNFVDALRSGVVLLILLQKLQNPPVADEELKIPKRSTGFYARDNVISFLRAAAHTFNLLEAQLFTDSDLCDGKNDRVVVTCLLSMARIAYTRGATHLAPAMILYEQEINSQSKEVTQEFIDYMVNKDVEEENAKEDNENETENENENEVEAEETPRETVTTEEDVERKQENIKNGEVTIPQDEIAVTEDQESPQTISKIESTEIEKEKSSGRLFYIRSGIMNAGQQCMPEAATTSDETTEKTTVKTPPKIPSPPAHIDPPRYRPRKRDDIDILLSIIVNTHFVLHPSSQIRFRRLVANSGEYIVYHRSARHKRVLYLRILQRKLVVGQARDGRTMWVDFREWLEQYERDTAS